MQQIGQWGQRRVIRLAAITMMVAGSCALGPVPGQASENGGNTYPNGAEGFMAGAVPPPGTYFLNYLTHYQASRINDSKGNKLPFDVEIRATAEVARFLHVSDITILGGAWGGHILIPLVHVAIDSPVAALDGRHSGLGDITIDPFILSWHAGNWHWVTGIDVVVPTGQYDKAEPASSIGRNYWAIEPVFGITYLSPGGFEASGKFMFDYNFKNRDRDYKSGNEFHIDYTLSQKFGDMTAGIGGYYFHQITDDSGTLAPADGNRGKALAIGPQLKYDYKGMSFIGKWQHEVIAENRAQGDKFWFKFITRF